MKATLNFNLPEENEEFRLAVDGIKWMSAMHELDQHIRGITKYDSEGMSQETYDALCAVREKLREILMDNNLSL